MLFRNKRGVFITPSVSTAARSSWDWICRLRFKYHVTCTYTLLRLGPVCKGQLFVTLEIMATQGLKDILAVNNRFASYA